MDRLDAARLVGLPFRRLRHSLGCNMVPRLWSTDRMRHLPLLIVAVGLLPLAAGGCAHHRLSSDYGYQPPLAPAVYHQPIDSTQPVAPVVTTGVPAVGQTAIPPMAAPQVVMPQPGAGQTVYGGVVGAGAAMVPCDPATMAAPLQTQPCPPAL